MIKQAEEHKEVSERVKQGFYLSSVFVQVPSFDAKPVVKLVFFKPKSLDVFTVQVDPFEVSGISKPAVKSHYPKLEFKGYLSVEQALEKFKEYAVKEDLSVMSVICTLREEKWVAYITTRDLNAHVVSLDAKTGDFVSKDVGNLIRTDVPEKPKIAKISPK